MIRNTLFSLVCLAACSCAAAPARTDAVDRSAPEPAPAATAHSWVWILTGPKDAELQGEARNAAFVGHFENMGRMAENGELLVAGPFGEPRVQNDHRGIFLLATDDLSAAREIANTDPTAQVGVFVFEVEPFRSADPLALIGPRHEAYVEANPPADARPGYHSRPYVLVEGVPAARAEQALLDAPVLFSGRIGAGANERALACLDATTREQALALLDADGVTWTVMPWFASEEVAGLRDGAR